MQGLAPGAVLRLTALAMGMVALMPVQMLVMRVAPSRGAAIPRLFHRLTCRCLGVRRRVRGTPPPAGSSGLIVANHVSWLDIAVLGAERPVCFVAKSEVATWPVIGFLAKLQRTVFIDRSRRAATADVAAQMGERLLAGEAVVLFAEGTTGDGTRILPMRSSLLGAAHEALGRGKAEPEADIAVYPLTISYTGFHGMAGGRAERSLLAWYGDTELAPHLKTVLRAGAIDVELVWGEPIAMGRETSRKEATRRAEAAIRKARQETVSGRTEP
ncbi:MAG: lysophospholipid acyltransferase family protein [Bosea sp. (in: a-proteobacteria)]|uniref:lysophospholipid acyltransferase family protein n=1 Tax=Bosea sp. (in: a-proteobacteria) TaxID=1871050 RepID=UPI0027341638|nr:lysophospholipid acyltransferase family protein [Bosea sp. (in: a-proteobacteria)]MDP3254359.1 lysophospholipid acyltransferase family protein [Bosea sp. (in: a-proteobacteria)]MDP3321077.1 lysophospholipid acyltransferase family protein [Bosea sp. (in: a-proteobacteria)]